jgi:uncharacterized protein (TIRG00374 family)
VRIVRDPRARGSLRLALKILLSLACLYVIWKWIDPARLGKDLEGAAWTTFAAAVALNLSHKVLNAYKIRFLLPPPRPALARVAGVNFIMVFFTTFLPGGVGGEIARWTYLSRESRSRSMALAAILLDRTTGLWAQVFLTVIAWLCAGGYGFPFWAAAPAALAVLLASLWAGLWGYRRFAIGLGKLAAWHARKRGDPEETPGGMADALADLLATRARLRVIAALSLASQSLVVAIFMLIDRTVGGDLGMAQAMLLLFCYTCVSLLPVTIGNWGLSEGALGILYHYAGSHGATGVAISLLLRLMDLPAAFLGWILFLRNRSR